MKPINVSGSESGLSLPFLQEKPAGNLILKRFDQGSRAVGRAVINNEYIERDSQVYDRPDYFFDVLPFIVSGNYNKLVGHRNSYELQITNYEQDNAISKNYPEICKSVIINS